MSEFQSSEMWISRELIEEKLPIEHCSLEDFREICKDQKWSVKSYRLGLEGILNSFGIEIDRRKNHIKALVNFLNTKPDKATPKTLGRDIGGKKRKREDTSMVISSDEEEGFAPSRMDISASTVMSLDEDPEILELKRLLCESEKENKGT